MNIYARRLALLTLGFAVLASTLAPAQATAAPQQQNTTAQPKDFSGMYSFLREGEFLQLTVADDAQVIGLISRYRNEDADPGDGNDSFVDQFFKSSKLEGNRLSFITEAVDGLAYEFHGEIYRGDGKVRSDEGYYVLKGTLTETKTDSSKKTSSSSREVVLKSFPQDLGSPSGSK